MNASGMRHAFAALLVYGAVALAFLWPLILRMSTHVLSYDIYGITDATDSFEWVWRYWWMLTAVTRGLPLFQCDWVLPPTGANLVFHSHPITAELMTLPIGLVFGPVVGTNVMILTLLVMGAWVYFLFLRSAFRLAFVPSLMGGALFGFSPYFLWRAHVHVNMMGACFWGGALAVLVYALHRERMGLRTGILFGALYWATFWNSFVEVFMLTIVCTIVTTAFSVRPIFQRKFLYRRFAAFLTPTLLVAASLTVFRGAPAFETIHMPLIDTSGFIDLVRFPKLSVFAEWGTASRPANWGVTIPFVTLGLCIPGVAYFWRQRPALAGPLGAIVAALLVVTCDPFNATSTTIRMLPLGEGFRLFTRFFPFLLFFVTIFAAYGAEWLWHRHVMTSRRTVRPQFAERAMFHVRVRGMESRAAWILLAAALLAAVELYPAGIRIRPVRALPITAEIRETLANGQFCLVVPPETSYLQIDNTYQVALDMPCVLISFWDKMDKGARALREERFSHVYRRTTDYAGKPATENPEIRQQLAELNVGFVLFGDKKDLLESVLRGRVLLETDREILLELDGQQ